MVGGGQEIWVSGREGAGDTGEWWGQEIWVSGGGRRYG